MAYVYRHIRLDKNVPFYIGIGGGTKHYRAYSLQRKASHIWNRIAAKTEYAVEILMDGLTWAEACEKEREFVRLYGRIDKGTGTLANMTDGGEGRTGLVFTPELRAKYGNVRRGKKNSPESNKRRGDTQRGKYVSKETREKIGAAHKGRKISDERKKHLSAINTGKKRPPEVAEKIKKTRSEREYVYVGRKKSEEEKKKIGDYHKGKKWALGRKMSDEYKKKKSEMTKTKKPVCQYSLDGNMVQEYGSQREAEISLGIGFAKEAIGRACKGVHRGYKNHTYKGFIWKYKC